MAETQIVAKIQLVAILLLKTTLLVHEVSNYGCKDLLSSKEQNSDKVPKKWAK